MSPAKPVTIGRNRFPRQGDAEAYFKQMLAKYSIGQTVLAADVPDLAALLSRHNDYSSKIGSGILGFGVMKGEFGTKCFSVRRSDGTEIDFSYLRCIRQDW